MKDVLIACIDNLTDFAVAIIQNSVIQEMDATAPELGVNCRATTNQVWRENASGDITHFPFFAFQTQRKGSSRM